MRPVRNPFHFEGGKLFFCDMRPGFTEDGLAISLPRGDYCLSLGSSAAGLTGFTLLLDGATSDTHRMRGSLEIDMARVGVFDRAAFKRIFARDAEALFEWSADASQRSSPAWGGFLRHPASGYSALYVNIGSDCTCSVEVLLSGARPVGVRVTPNESAAQPPAAAEAHTWTTVEVKCRGIGSAWQFGERDDRPPKFDYVLEEILDEVSAIEIGDTIPDPETIDPDAPITRYQPRFDGVAAISLFRTREGSSRRERIQPSPSATKFQGTRTTSRQLATIVYDLIQNARQSA